LKEILNFSIKNLIRMNNLSLNINRIQEDVKEDNDNKIISSSSSNNTSNINSYTDTYLLKDIISSSVLQNFLIFENILKIKKLNESEDLNIKEDLFNFIIEIFKSNQKKENLKEIDIKLMFFEKSIKLILMKEINFLNLIELKRLREEEEDNRIDHLYLFLIQFNELFNNLTKNEFLIIEYLKLFIQNLKISTTSSTFLKKNLNFLIFQSKETLKEIEILNQNLKNNLTNLSFDSLIFEFLFLISGNIESSSSIRNKLIQNDEIKNKIIDLKKIIKNEKWIKMIIKEYYKSIEIENEFNRNIQ